MTEWISVKKRYPPPYHFVMVFCDTKTEEPSSYSLARWEGQKKGWNIIGERDSVWSDLYWGIDKDSEITHWMPLPNPPKGKDE